MANSATQLQVSHCAVVCLFLVLCPAVDCGGRQSQINWKKKNKEKDAKYILIKLILNKMLNYH